MSYNFSYFRNLVTHAGGDHILAENPAEIEKYSSIINILKGFEEFTLDRNGVIVSSNLETVNITGYEEWEVIGSNFSIFYSIEDQLTGKPYHDLQKAEELGLFVFSGLQVKKRNPSFWAKVKLRTLKENGDTVGFKMTLQDTTYRALSNHRVRKLRDEYLSLFNNSFVGFFKFRVRDHTILLMNEKAGKLFGLRQKQNEKIHFHDLFESEDKFYALKKKLFNEKRIEEFEFQVRGTDRWLMLSGRYFQDGDFAECVVADITEIKKKDREINRLNHELDQFIYHASHELRAPLASMLGVINLISIENDIRASHEYSNILKEKVRQLDDLLKNIVAISYNNKNELSRDHVEWNKLIPGVLKELDVSRSGVVVSYQVVQQTVFINDIPRLVIIIRNLISNALKYHNPNARESWVNITVTSRERFATIVISDNGSGIDPEYLHKIFQMFYKANNFAKGTGLGLYITKSIVERLHGKINVTSNLNEGTTFTITLPDLSMVRV